MQKASSRCSWWDWSSGPACPRSSRLGWWPTPAVPAATTTDGTAHAPNPVLKYLGVLLFVFVGWVIVTAIAWITRATIIHHFGVDLFPFMPKK